MRSDVLVEHEKQIAYETSKAKTLLYLEKATCCGR
jgi:hypothetical protein